MSLEQRIAFCAATCVLWSAGCASQHPSVPVEPVADLSRPNAVARAEAESSRLFKACLRQTFAAEGTAIDRGEELLEHLRSHDRQAAASYVGRTAAFVGAAAPPGRNADLVVDDGVRLLITIRPETDVRPGSVIWEAGVLGTVRAVDVDGQTISIDAKPEDWRVFMTW